MDNSKKTNDWLYGDSITNIDDNNTEGNIDENKEIKDNTTLTNRARRQAEIKKEN